MNLNHPTDDEAGCSREPDASVVVIKPPRLADLRAQLQSFWTFLPLLKVVIWRLAITKYLQSVLGIMWLVIQPLATTLVILFMFNIVRINTSDGPNNGLFLLVGIVSWQFFARAAQDATGSLITNRGILTKVYLPKLMFPVASVLAAWFDLAVVMVMVVIAFLVVGVPFSERLLFLPIFLLLLSLAALAVGVGLSAVNALYRDVGFIVGFALQIGIYVTPVLYSTRFVPEAWRPLYYLNPLSTLMEGVRWTLLPTSLPPDPFYLAVNIITILAVLGGGVLLFQALDSEIVDRI